jgi:capsular exopolysaccharide synthesis family protein
VEGHGTVSIREYFMVLRTRWVILFITTAVAVLSAIGYTLATTPLYEASTRLFVSTTGGASASDRYQGNRLSLDRVLSYTQLLTGETLAMRTADRLSMDPTVLRGLVTATTKRDTVLIDVSVRNASPVRARDLANALSDEFVGLVRELETPSPGVRPDARVIVEQRATIPTKPVVPRPLLNIAAGLVFGLVIGSVLAFLRDLTDNTVKKAETVESITETSLVGTIPVQKDIRNCPTISFDRDNSGIAEAFRKLRTNLQFLGVDHPPRVIVVVSSSANEGKTTTAINLALALAEAEHSVVIVDGDLRRPSLGSYLNLVGTVGFSTALSGSATLPDVLQETKFPRLTALTAGVTPPNPSELLGSLAAKKLLAELREMFDYVIIDSPPLLAVTDGAILAAGVDGALIIARYGQTKRGALGTAVRSLHHVGASILGTILSMVPSNRASYYGYGNGYYGEKLDEQESEHTVERSSKSPPQNANSIGDSES